MQLELTSHPVASLYSVYYVVVLYARKPRILILLLLLFSPLAQSRRHNIIIMKGDDISAVFHHLIQGGRKSRSDYSCNECLFLQPSNSHKFWHMHVHVYTTGNWLRVDKVIALKIWCFWPSRV